MCEPISMAIMAGAAVLGAGTGIYTGIKQASAAKAGARRAEAQAADERARQTRENNRLNQKTPDLASITNANRMRNSTGVGSTMLTGPLSQRLTTSLTQSLGGGVSSLLGGQVKGLGA